VELIATLASLLALVAFGNAELAGFSPSDSQLEFSFARTIFWSRDVLQRTSGSNAAHNSERRRLAGMFEMLSVGCLPPAFYRKDADGACCQSHAGESVWL